MFPWRVQVSSRVEKDRTQSLLKAPPAGHAFGLLPAV